MQRCSRETISPAGQNSFCTLTFYRAPGKKGCSFFPLWGDPVRNRPQNPAPAACLFSTRKSRFEVPERGILGKKIAWGRVGVERAKKKKKKGKKGCAKKKKKRGIFHRVLCPFLIYEYKSHKETCIQQASRQETFFAGSYVLSLYEYKSLKETCGTPLGSDHSSRHCDGVMDSCDA